MPVPLMFNGVAAVPRTNLRKMFAPLPSGNPRALIRDRRCSSTPSSAMNRHADRADLRRVLQGVVHQVAQRQRDRVAVGANRAVVRAGLSAAVTLVHSMRRLRRASELLDHASRDLGRVGLGSIGKFAGRTPSVPKSSRLSTSACSRRVSLRARGILRDAIGRRVAFLEHLGEVAHRRERRAKLVRDGGDEIALQPRGASSG